MKDSQCSIKKFTVTPGDTFLQNSPIHEFQEWSHVHIFGAKREKEVSVVIWNLGSHNSRSLVRITPSSGDRHLSVIAGTHTESARRAQSIRQSFLTNNPLRPPDGSSISLLLSRGLNTVLSWFRSSVQLFFSQPRSSCFFYRPWSRSVVRSKYCPLPVFKNFVWFYNHFHKYCGLTIKLYPVTAWSGRIWYQFPALPYSARFYRAAARICK